MTKERIKTYLRRVKNHPGVGLCVFLTLLFIAAGFKHGITWQAVAVGLVASLPFWVVMLITARDQPLPKDETDD